MPSHVMCGGELAGILKIEHALIADWNGCMICNLLRDKQVLVGRMKAAAELLNEGKVVQAYNALTVLTEEE